MADVILLEPSDDPAPTGNVEDSQHEEVTETPEAQKVEETPAVEAGETPKTEALPDEPTVEVDGEKIPLSQVKKWREDTGNDSKWRLKNEQRSAELSRKEQELATLTRLVQPLIEDAIRAKAAPQASKNYEAELAAWEQKRPDDPFSPEFKEWDKQRLQMVREQTREESIAAVEQKISERESTSNNSRIETEAFEKYSKKGVDEQGFRDMAEWIKSNLNRGPKGYPANCFDIAYRELHQEEVVAEAKVKSTEEVRKSVLNAKPAKPETGVNKKIETPTPEEQEDAEFVARVNSRNKK